MRLNGWRSWTDGAGSVCGRLPAARFNSRAEGPPPYTPHTHMVPFSAATRVATQRNLTRTSILTTPCMSERVDAYALFTTFVFVIGSWSLTSIHWLVPFTALIPPDGNKICHLLDLCRLANGLFISLEPCGSQDEPTD
jgi:hypothetical protein